jgi:hypothetical protein
MKVSAFYVVASAVALRLIARNHIRRISALPG